MPTLAHKKRRAEIRDYYKENYAARGIPPSDARQDIQARFGVPSKQWYNLRDDLELVRIRTKVNKDNGSLVEAPPETNHGPLVEVPANLPEEGKQAVNSLLSINGQQEGQIAELRSELAAMRHENARNVGKIRVLKKMLDEALSNW